MLVGLPVITSPRGLRFWLDLCGVGNNPGISKKAFETFANSPPTAQQPEPLKEEENTGATTDPSLGIVGRGSRPASGSEETEASSYGQAWFETTMSRLKSLDDSGVRVAGVHVMAPGPGPRRRASELASRGVFGSPRGRGRE